MKIRKRWMQTLLIGSALCSTMGCKSLSLPTSLPWSKSKVIESKFATPTRMAAIWTDDVLSQPGKPLTRGFGGRVYFYNEVNKTVEVEGQLVVYAYDDAKQKAQPQGSARVPDRKFVFTPEQFKSHYSESDLGHSYSIWIPWDEAFGDSKEISLVPVFTASSGQVVMGQQSANFLPGRNRDGSPMANRVQLKKKTEPAEEVRTVNHESAVETKPQTNSAVMANSVGAASAAPAKSARTTTIFVPDSLSRKMAAASAAAVAADSTVNPMNAAPQTGNMPQQINPAAATQQEKMEGNSQPATTDQFQRLRTGRLPMSAMGTPSPAMATLLRPAAPTANLPSIRSALGPPQAQAEPTVPR